MRPYDTRDYRRARAAVRDMPCHYCGRPGPSTAHHVVSVRRGGANDRSNIVPACQSCNNKIAARETAYLRRSKLPARTRGAQRLRRQRNRRA